MSGPCCLATHVCHSVLPLHPTHAPQMFRRKSAAEKQVRSPSHTDSPVSTLYCMCLCSDAYRTVRKPRTCIWQLVFIATLWLGRPASQLRELRSKLAKYKAELLRCLKNAQVRIPALEHEVTTTRARALAELKEVYKLGMQLAPVQAELHMHLTLCVLSVGNLQGYFN